MLKHRKSLSWGDYYNDTIHKHYENKRFAFGDKSLFITSGNTYIYNCYFYKLTAENGGAIHYSVKGSYFLFEKGTINNCTATENTAGIRVSNGDCVIAYVCGQHDCAGNYDGFCSICDDTNRNINSIFYSSISSCEAKTQYTLVLDYGPLNIKTLNLSQNKANYYSILYCVPNKAYHETGLVTDVSFCSFSNNTGQQYSIYFSYHGSNNKHQMKNCNLIGNVGTNTLYLIGETNIYLSSFVSNGDPYFLTNANSTIILSMCYTDKSDIGSATRNSEQSVDQFILSLPFHQTMACLNHFNHCTENSLLRNLHIHKIIIPSPFLFLLLSNRK